jgi:tetratricopeptide (TPR) repeat protein/tRNA A-37 threonylcarbamoyl transferase component Bud32
MVDLGATLRSALDGRYAIEGEVGRGGMSVVFKARDLKHNRTVAIKVLKPELSEQVGTDRFQREVEFAANLTNPHILPLFDSGEAAGQLYYVMPCIEGGTLKERIERDGPLDIEDALAIARQVAGALEAAHEHGIVHRDIKPANILFSGGEAMVADFGIARAVAIEDGDRLTQSGLSVGSPAFMSPEQAGGDPVDGRSDLYSLGCVLYTMLAGEPPFVRPTAQATITAQLADPPPSIRDVRPEVPKGVDEIILTALQKSPDDRFASATEMIAALDHPELMPRQAKQRRRRRRLRVGEWSLALAAGAVGVSYLAWRAYAPEPLPPTDANRVMVFPLLERGNTEPGTGLDAAITIGNALNYADPLTFVDGWTWLDAERRADVGLLTSDVARQTALGQRARWYVTGTILGAADSATVTLLLHDALADTSAARELAMGAAGFNGVVDAGLAATTRLLPVLLEPGRTIDPSVLAASRSSHPVAMLEWVEGEKAYRASHFEPALAHYEAAIDADSSWAFAAFKGAQAASWINRTEPALALVEIALGSEGVLPPKYRSFAHGLQHYLLGESREAVDRFEEALALDPDWAEGWMGLGEVHYHLQPDWTDLAAQASRAFHRALDADSAFVLPLYHLSELALRAGDLEEAGRLIPRFAAASPARDMLTQLVLMQACITEGPDSIDWDSRVREEAEGVVRAGLGFGTGGHQLDCARAALTAVLDAEAPPEEWVWGAYFALNTIAVVRGQADEAEAIIQRAVEAGYQGAVALRLVNAFAGETEFDASASELVDVLLGDLDAMGSERLWYLGSWYDHTGDIENLRAVANALTRRADATGAIDFRMLGGGMAARVAIAEGDTLRALQLLEAIHPFGRRADLEWDFEKGLPRERLLLAELLLARGDHQRAIEVAKGFELEPQVYVLYMPRSLEIRAEAARGLNDP